MQLSFFGATQTVTGSRYLLTCDGRRLLIDCGLFQGYKHLRLKNWARLPFDAGAVDAVLLTHAHLDHSGYLPLLVRNGFKGPIYATKATIELCRILLPDSGHLQEEQAEFANRHGFSKHSPALPLYLSASRCDRHPDVRGRSRAAALATGCTVEGGRRDSGVFVTHGEPSASDVLRQRIQTELGWPASVPESRSTGTRSRCRRGRTTRRARGNACGLRGTPG